jgi:hypothetical protein
MNTFGANAYNHTMQVLRNLPPVALAILFLAAPVAAMAQEAPISIGLLMETSRESWSTWGNGDSLPSGRGGDWDQAPWSPATLFRAEYSEPGFLAGADYLTGKGEFPSLGKSKRQRYSMDFTWRDQDYFSHGVYLGVRYYDFKFGDPTPLLHNHDYLEITLGYALAVNPSGPGPFMNFRFASPTLFWLAVIAAAAQDGNHVDIADFPLPLGLDMQLDGGYRLGAIELGVGYRFLFYDKFYRDGYNPEDYQRPMSGVVHGVFARIKIDLKIGGNYPAPQSGVWRW